MKGCGTPTEVRHESLPLSLGQYPKRPVDALRPIWVASLHRDLCTSRLRRLRRVWRPKNARHFDEFCGPFVRAAAFAAHHHRAQRRKGEGDVPYINHPLEVARILVDEGDIHDVEILMAAVLHDTVEDTEVTVADIVATFGASVAQYVAEVTDDKSLPKSERKRRQVMDAPTKSTGAKAIKLADKTSNIRDLVRNPPANWTRKRLRDYCPLGSPSGGRPARTTSQTRVGF